MPTVLDHAGAAEAGGPGGARAPPLFGIDKKKEEKKEGRRRRKKGKESVHPMNYLNYKMPTVLDHVPSFYNKGPLYTAIQIASNQQRFQICDNLFSEQPTINPLVSIYIIMCKE